MIRKCFIIILAFIVLQFNAQITMQLSIENYVAHVILKNNTNKAYMIPIDTKHLRPYENDCNNFSEQELEFPHLALMLDFQTKSHKRENSVRGHTSPENFERLKNVILISRQKYRKKIEKWKSYNSIKTYDDALINYNLINSLIFLNPNEEKEFSVKINLRNITSQELLFYNFFLDQNENYIAKLTFCKVDINKYLTSDQKRKFNKYKIMMEELESNSVEWKWQSGKE